MYSKCFTTMVLDNLLEKYMTVFTRRNKSLAKEEELTPQVTLHVKYYVIHLYLISLNPLSSKINEFQRGSVLV